VSASSFAWSSVNPLPIPLKCFARLLETIIEAEQLILDGIHVSRPVECQFKTTNVQGDQTPRNDRKCWKIRELINEDGRRKIH
jgi:hypothetical protein